MKGIRGFSKKVSALLKNSIKLKKVRKLLEEVSALFPVQCKKTMQKNKQKF